MGSLFVRGLERGEPMKGFVLVTAAIHIKLLPPGYKAAPLEWLFSGHRRSCQPPSTQGIVILYEAHIYLQQQYRLWCLRLTQVHGPT